MSESYAAGSIVIAPLEEVGESGNSVLRRAVRALEAYAGAELRPEGMRSTRFLAGEGSARTVALTHPAFTSANSWVQVMRGDLEPEGFAEIFLTVSLSEPGDRLAQEWKMAVALTSQLVASLHPSLTQLTAWNQEGDEDVYPSTTRLPGSGLPEEFGPWTYFAGDGLTDRLRERLAALPAFATGPLGDGWLVRAVENPGDEPAERLWDSLDALDEETIVYHSPRLAAA